MTDVTETVLRFRQVLHDLWNNYCWRSPDLRELDAMDAFEELALPLYRFFVRDALSSYDSRPPEKLFGAAFRVVPKMNAQGARTGTLEMMILLEEKPVWSREVARDLNEEDISFCLLGFFNWRQLYWRD
jgi:hypothetical protein